MTPEQKAAYVHAQAVAATAEIESMKALNKYREMRGETIGYSEDAFYSVIYKYGLGSNTIMLFFAE